MSTSLSKTFSAVNQASGALLLPKGRTGTYVITGTFVATLLLQRSHDNENWETVASLTATASSTAILKDDRDYAWRFFCSAYTSGSPAITLADAVDTISEVKNRDGLVVFRVTEEGIESPSLKGQDRAATPLDTVAIATLLSIAGLLRMTGSEDGLTAHAGGTQAAALGLSATKAFHRVSVCATNADSVKLPTAVAGELHLVMNSSGHALQVFGNGTATINDVATATGVSVPAGKMAAFYCLTGGAAGAWYMLLGA